MKPNKAAAVLVSELFDRKVIDESAETCDEIAAKTGRQVFLVRKQVRSMVESGMIEQVWKHGTRQLVPAYRTK
jgi:predicted transcriptional regulator